MNTLTKDGNAAAIVGRDSIYMSINAKDIENTEENYENIRQMIAKDLGIDIENLTIIPQYDFHIDMCYHPLGNDEVAVPDFQNAIEILEKTSIQNMSDEEKEILINNLRNIDNKSKDIREEAENILEQAGYKIVKIPCFSDNSRSQINFMNGVGGTTPANETFFISNDSGSPELNNAVKEYFQKSGVDKVFFVSTGSFLKLCGGIDCLTQES